MKSTHIQRWTQTILSRTARHSAVNALTGARQTGKTTIVRSVFPSWNYRNLDSSTERVDLGRLPAERFGPELSPAVLDEIQKAPRLFEKIKYAVDESDRSRFVITGSAQILLMRRIRETLAGRIRLHELFPLSLSELCRAPEPPLLVDLLRASDPSRLLRRIDGFKSAPTVLKHRDEMEKWGGMPKLSHLPQSERMPWLADYIRTYLERDLADLSKLDDITTFATLQRLIASRPAQLLSLSGLARDCGSSQPTVKRYVGYLTLSYQAFLVRPWSTHIGKRLVKSPKIVLTDVGVLRSLTEHWGGMNGNEYENWVLAEIYKILRTFSLARDLYFYRTHAGLEADVVVSFRNGLSVFEIKQRDHTERRDIAALEQVRADLGRAVKLLAVLTRGGTLRPLSKQVWQIPVELLLLPNPA